MLFCRNLGSFDIILGYFWCVLGVFKMMSIDAEIAQKLKNMLMLGGYDVIRGPKKVFGVKFLKYLYLLYFFLNFQKISLKSVILIFELHLWNTRYKNGPSAKSCFRDNGQNVIREYIFYHCEGYGLFKGSTFLPTLTLSFTITLNPILTSSRYHNSFK